MDINEVKRQADEMVADKEKIKTYQDEAKEKFEHLFKIQHRSDTIWDVKMRAVINKFNSDFKNYFEQNGFNVTCGNEFGGGAGNITLIETTYKEKKFKLSNINYDGEDMYFIDNGDINERIKITLPDDTPNYLCWKEMIKIGGKSFFDIGDNFEDKYCDFIERFNTVEELKELMVKINVNVLHYQDSISNADSINLCIYRYRTGSMYQNFKAFIEEV